MNKIDQILIRAVDEVLVKKSLAKRLRSKKKLVVKLGIDPTGSELHLGHAVVLRKLREFQDLGHQVFLVIGDFTAKIGDPSGRTLERKSITKKQIEENMKTYKEQALKILDTNKLRFVSNSSWFNKLGLEGVLELASKATFAQINKRKEFRTRFQLGEDIPYLEMLYPLMQGYDSVQLKADVELGGTDQKFNLLMGRQIQKRYGQKEQDLVITKLLSGTDGAKMSKSAGNYISLTAKPADMYGKVMSISDNLLPEFFELCTDVSLEKIKLANKTVKKGGPEVMGLKKKLAKMIVGLYHGKLASIQAESDFEKVYQKGNYSESLLTHATIPPGTYNPIELPIISGTTTSTVRAKELVKQGAVSVGGGTVTVETKEIKLSPGDSVKIGKKRFIKVEK